MRLVCSHDEKSAERTSLPFHPEPFLAASPLVLGISALALHCRRFALAASGVRSSALALAVDILARSDYPELDSHFYYVCRARGGKPGKRAALRRRASFGIVASKIQGPGVSGGSVPHAARAIGRRSA